MQTLALCPNSQCPYVLTLVCTVNFTLSRSLTASEISTCREVSPGSSEPEGCGEGMPVIATHTPLFFLPCPWVVDM